MNSGYTDKITLDYNNWTSPRKCHSAEVSLRDHLVTPGSILPSGCVNAPWVWFAAMCWKIGFLTQWGCLTWLSLFLVSQIVEGGGSSYSATSFLGNAEQKMVLVQLHGIIPPSYTAFPFAFFQSYFSEMSHILSTCWPYSAANITLIVYVISQKRDMNYLL